jgi:hypothetical protein
MMHHPLRQCPVTAAWLNRLTEACRPFYVLAFADDQHDYMTNVLLTLLDFQMHNKMVEFADFLAAWAMARGPGHEASRPPRGGR